MTHKKRPPKDNPTLSKLGSRNIEKPFPDLISNLFHFHYTTNEQFRIFYDIADIKTGHMKNYGNYCRKNRND